MTNHSHFTSPFLFIQTDCPFISKAHRASYNRDVRTLQPPKYLQEEKELISGAKPILLPFNRQFTSGEFILFKSLGTAI